LIASGLLNAQILEALRAGRSGRARLTYTLTATRAQVTVCVEDGDPIQFSQLCHGLIASVAAQVEERLGVKDAEDCHSFEDLTSR
jgi:hypothetical protein